SNDEAVFQRCIGKDIYLGRAVVNGYGGTAGEGKVQFTGFIKHPLGVVPIVGEVFVVKDWHRAVTLLEDLDHLLVDPPARQEPVSFEIGWIVAVFADDDNT